MHGRRIARLTAAISVAAVMIASASAVASDRGAGPAGVRIQPVAAPDGAGIDRRAAPGDALTRALEARSVSPVGYSYLRALSLWHYRAVQRRFGDVYRPSGRDATMILRDLVAHQSQLAGARRAAAASLLARPTDGSSDPHGDGYTTEEATPLCSDNVCVHWVTTTADAVPSSDQDANGTPDFADAVSSTLEDVWDQEVTSMGYRAPKSDATSTHHGPDGRLDVYLADIGSKGYYGYCTTDDPNIPTVNYRFYDVSAYCVLDNDYSPSQFPAPAVSGLAALQSTAAHELFHAVQFAYDVEEDLWLMEGTATWIEDELYDDVNDGLRYLRASALKTPWIPVDRGNGWYQYGAWIFWEYLSERFDAGIVRQTWRYADGSRSGLDQYSLTAVAHAIRDRRARFARTFADFGTWNTWPRAFYHEGDAYPIATRSATLRITGQSGGTGWRHLSLDHLTNPLVQVEPSSGLDVGAKLRVSVDAPPTATSPAASIVVHRGSGATETIAITLDAGGDGSTTIPFGRGQVAWATLVLTNASGRMRCWATTVYSCAGKPRDDNVVFRYSMELIDGR